MTPRAPRSDAKPGPLPLVVGVTGHRDPRDADLPRLEAAVSHVLGDLRRRHPHTPLEILSPLAEGADRLVARVGLDLGARLVVALPMGRESYERDFPDSKGEFAALLERAEHAFVLAPPAGVPPGSAEPPGTERDRLYAGVGAFVARNSHVLLALWDGRESDKAGGTADVVRIRTRGVPWPGPAAQGPLDPAEIGPVVQVLTPRRGDPDPARDPGSVRWIFPLGPADRDARAAGVRHARTRERLDRFNADAARLERRLKAARARSRDELFPAADAESLSPEQAFTRDVYGIADALAIRFQQSALGALRRLFYVVFAGVVMFGVYDELGKEPAFLAGYMLALAFAAATYLVASGKLHELAAALPGAGRSLAERLRPRGDYKRRHEDYRALAEALRVQFCWRLAGVDEAVDAHYLRKQRGELEWIRKALQAWSRARRGWRRNLRPRGWSGSCAFGSRARRHTSSGRRHATSAGSSACAA